MMHCALTQLAHAQDVEIVVHPIPRIVSNWLIGIGRLLATLIKLKVTASIPAHPSPNDCSAPIFRLRYLRTLGLICLGYMPGSLNSWCQKWCAHVPFGCHVRPVEFEAFKCKL